MSLSAREQRDLSAIKMQLADTDHELVSLLAAFTRLNQGEEMPLPERLPDRGRLLGMNWLRPGWRSKATGRVRLLVLAAGLIAVTAGLVAGVVTWGRHPGGCASALSPSIASERTRTSCGNDPAMRRTPGPAYPGSALVPGL
jgi:hypothetical protein